MHRASVVLTRQNQTRNIKETIKCWSTILIYLYTVKLFANVIVWMESNVVSQYAAIHHLSTKILYKKFPQPCIIDFEQHNLNVKYFHHHIFDFWNITHFLFSHQHNIILKYTNNCTNPQYNFKSKPNEQRNHTHGIFQALL